MFGYVRIFFLAALIFGSAFACLPAKATEPSKAALQSAGEPLHSEPSAGAEQEEEPLVSVAAGLIYLQNDLADTPGGAGSYLLGWYGIPEYHINERLSLFADFTNLYNFHAHQTENVHGFAGGPEFTLPLHVRGAEVFVYGEGGATRDSIDGEVQWDPTAAGGFGLNFKLTHSLAFQVIPGEYNAIVLSNGNWQSNYDARAGFVWTTFRRKHQAAK